MVEETLKNDPAEMKISSEASWLCRFFQSHGLTVADKQYLIKDMIKQLKIKRLNKNGQSA